MLHTILPSWVEPDPLRSRATDALGLQAVADRLADRLLPGLSVLTTRARYFTFLAWARHVCGGEYRERKIHRYEVALALVEASLSEADAGHAETCRFVGSRNIKSRNFPLDRVPLDPRRVYTVPVWRAYRASMMSLGLIQGPPRYVLTDDGASAAGAFRGAARPRKSQAWPLPRRACLSEIGEKESRLLRSLLGLSVRGRLALDSESSMARRAAFAREVRSVFRKEGLSPETVLVKYELLRSASLPEPAETLRAAAVWERLSLGLNVLFTAWIRGIEHGRRDTVERRAAELVSIGLKIPSLEPIGLTDESSAIAKGVASLRHAIRLNDRLRDRGVNVGDAEAFELARAFIAHGKRPRARVDHAFEMLLRRHRSVKGDEAWVRDGASRRLELARDAGDTWMLPQTVRPHAYRMSAFSQVATDLGGL